MNITAAILYGGIGREHDVSVMGFSYMSELVNSIGFKVLPIYIAKDGYMYLSERSGISEPVSMVRNGFMTRDSFIPADVAIPLLHGDGGEDGVIQGALEHLSVPYIGADCITSAVCLDKHYTKCIARRLGIPTANWLSFSKKDSTGYALSASESRLNYPMFIKPRRLGSSFGIHAVMDRDAFSAAYEDAQDSGDGTVIVEEMIQDKREIEVAFFGTDHTSVISMPGEIFCKGTYGYGEKYGGNIKTSAAASTDRHTSALITEYSNLLAADLGLRHLGRIDYFLSGEKIYFNEVNTFPGFTRDSLYPRLLRSSGIEPRDAIESFILDAIG